MKTIRSKITAQGQVSVPADVRKTLGVGPGSFVEWVEEDGRIVIRRAGSVTFEEIHKMLFPDGPPAHLADPRKAGVEAYVRKRYGRRD